MEAGSVFCVEKVVVERSAEQSPHRRRQWPQYGDTGMDIQGLLKRITIDPEIAHGKPCIRGLRYPVEMILELLSGGMSNEELLADYEDLEYEDILASLAFATRLSQVKRLETVLA
jgi:uncharacterized protein (DUF433 family)